MKYLAEVNANKEFYDARIQSNKINTFLMWLEWRIKYNDLDHYSVNNGYREANGKDSPTGKPMTKEQQIWFSFIFGMTYQSEMAWVIYWNFPNFYDIDLKILEEWNNDTYSIQKYARDTRYNKGKILDQVKSLKAYFEKFESLQKGLEPYLQSCPEENFQKTYSFISNSFFKYGRMSSWITCQALFETANLLIKPADMLCYDNSNWSVRSGLMYLYDRLDLIESKSDVVLSKSDYEFVLQKEKQIVDLTKELYSKDCNDGVFSNYLLESHLCQFKKLMLGGSTSHDYPGHSSLDHIETCNHLKELWKGVNFDVFTKTAEKNYHPLVLKIKKDFKCLGELCSKTGQLINMHEDYDFLPDMQEELGLKIGEMHLCSETEIKNRISEYENKLFNKNKKTYLF